MCSEIETAFRGGWRPVGAGQPRVLTGHAYTEPRQILDHGGWTGVDQETIEAARAGAHPGDPLPPLAAFPYIDHVADAQVIITGRCQRWRVAVMFSHQHFPGVRFGHRFPADPDGAGDLLCLKEEVETCALDRMKPNPPAADKTGITWTTWGDPVQD